MPPAADILPEGAPLLPRRRRDDRLSVEAAVARLVRVEANPGDAWCHVHVTLLGRDQGEYAEPEESLFIEADHPLVTLLRRIGAPHRTTSPC